jgi:hypothetical protein
LIKPAGIAAMLRLLLQKCSTGCWNFSTVLLYRHDNQCRKKFSLAGRQQPTGEHFAPCGNDKQALRATNFRIENDY